MTLNPISDTTSALFVQAAYAAANWPLSHAALSADGADVAVAGTRGLAVYSRRSARWRLFGDVSQEREIAVQARALAHRAQASSGLWVRRHLLAYIRHVEGSPLSYAAWVSRRMLARIRHQQAPQPPREQLFTPCAFAKLGA